MNKQEIFDAIINYEMEVGEDFLDQGFNLHPLTFMTWCFGKGYLTKEKYNLWSDAYTSRIKGMYLESHDANYFVYASHGCKVPFAVVSSDDWNEECQHKAYMILAEFISKIDIYIDRLKEFTKEVM